MLDVIHCSRHGALADRDHTLLNFFGSEAAIAPDDCDDGYINCRKNVLRHSEVGQKAEAENECRHHREGVRATKSEADDPHNRKSLPPATDGFDQYDRRRESLSFVLRKRESILQQGALRIDDFEITH